VDLPSTLLEAVAIALVVIVLIVVLWMAKSDWEKNQKKAHHRVALLMGFTSYSDIGVWFQDIPDILEFGLFSWAEDTFGVQTPVLRGSFSSNDVLLFDYVYGQQAQHSCWSRQTVACFKQANITIPNFQLIAKKNFYVNPDFRTFRGSRIQLENNPTFSKRYSLHASDEHEVRAMFDQIMLDFFAHHEGWSVEAGRGWLLVYRRGSTVEPAQIPSFLAETKRIFILVAGPAANLERNATILREEGQEAEAAKMEARVKAIREKNAQ